MGQRYQRSTAECCENHDPDFDGRCGEGLGFCGLPGDFCTSGSCCGGSCIDSICCISDGGIIDPEAECCNGNPDADIYCGTRNCIEAGEPVSGSAELQCCSGTATFFEPNIGDRGRAPVFVHPAPEPARPPVTTKVAN